MPSFDKPLGIDEDSAHLRVVHLMEILAEGGLGNG
jgi:hypothetical protein